MRGRGSNARAQGTVHTVADSSLKRELNRPASAEEIAIVRWMLNNAPVGDIAAYRDVNLDDLHVVGACACGCISVDFEEGAWGHAKMIADATAEYPDGLRAGLILWGKDGRIVLLEVHDWDPDASHRMPTIADLRS
jgi:hypothetical protein